MTRQEIQGEITACKQLLADSDFSILKTLEGLLSCTSATGMITYLKGLTGDLAELVQRRQAWRDKVNDLEAQLETVEDEQPLEEAVE